MVGTRSKRDPAWHAQKHELMPNHGLTRERLWEKSKTSFETATPDAREHIPTIPSRDPTARERIPYREVGGPVRYLRF